MTLDRMIVPFKPEHFKWLDAKVHVTDDELRGMARQNSWTAVLHGTVIACAGVITYWPGRHYAWAYMSPATGQCMRWLTREAHKRMSAPKGRVEITVRTDFAAGHRWAGMLGFHMEAPVMQHYGPHGEDHTLYARVN